ncbi:MAG: PAS domain S-box protein [Anaerolineae bacterium]|nr:PAS domain S-box protein [Anaerolineae bacterium]
MDDSLSQILLITQNSKGTTLLRRALKEAHTCYGTPLFTLVIVGEFEATWEKLHGAEIVLLDIAMILPQWQHILAEMRKIRPFIPIIVLATSEIEPQALELLSAGVQDYLLWDEVNGCVLQRVIRYAVDRRLIAESERLNARLEQEIAERERVETALLQSEERFRTVAHFTYDWEYWLAPEGHYLYISPSCQRLTGYRPEEFYADPHLLEKIIYAEDRARVCEHLQRERETQGVQFIDFRIVTRGREIRWFGHICQPVYGQNRRYLGRRASNRDITEQKLVTIALQESVEKFRSIVDQSYDGIVLLNEEGIIVECNKAWERIAGLEHADVIGYPIWDVAFALTPREKRKQSNYEQYKANILKTSETRHSSWFNQLTEYEIERPDAQRRCIQLVLFPVEMTQRWLIGGVIRDITEQKRAEEALHRSEAQLARIIEGTSALLLNVDLQGRITYVNEATARLLELHPREMLGKFYLRYVHPEDRERVNQAYKEQIATRQRATSLEFRVCSTNGRVSWVNFVANPIVENEQIVGQTGVALDITERKLAETALQQEKALLDTLLRDMPDSIYFKDRQGRHVRVSQSLVRSQAGGESQILGKTDVEIYGEEFGGQTLANDLQIMETGTPLVNIVERNVTPSGYVNWTSSTKVPLYDTSGQIIGLAGITRQINDLIRVQEALTESETRFRALFENSPDAIFVEDIQGQVILDVNPAGCRLHKMTREELLTCKVSDLLPQDIRDQIPPIIAKVLAGEQETLESFNLTQDGQVIPVEIRVSQMEYGGQPAFLLHVRDITERKRAEEVLRRTLAKTEALYYVARTLITHVGLPDMLQKVMNSIAEALPATTTLLINLDTKEQKVIRIWVGGESSYLNELDSFEKVMEGPSGEVIREWKPVLLPKEPYNSREFDGRVAHHQYNQGGSIMVVPLIYREELLGTLTAINDVFARDFTEEDVELMLAMANQTAIALENARLYQQALQDAETRATLLHEVNHRVKNNLTSIIGLLYAEQRYARGEYQEMYRAMIRELANRIQGLSQVHSMLSEHEWSPLPLDKLTFQIIDTTAQILPRNQHIILNVTPSPIKVTPKQANSLALIINELATNTFKHALGNRRTARIDVRITCEDQAQCNDRQVCFEYQDDGPGYPEAVLTLQMRSVGLHLLQSLVRGLKGELHLHNTPGATTTIRFKV